MSCQSNTEIDENSASVPAIVLYHYPCPDGGFAAAAAYMKFQQIKRRARFVPHRTFAPLLVDDVVRVSREFDEKPEVYLLDFAGSPGFAVSLAGNEYVSSVIVIDHHKTAESDLCHDSESLPKKLKVNFDMERSGAVLALEFFKPYGVSQDQRRLFDLVQDADLWKWKVKGSKEFYAGFASLKLELDATKNPGIFERLLNLSPEDTIERGKEQLEKQGTIISKVLGEAYTVKLGGSNNFMGTALAVRVTSDVASLRSQIGNELACEAERRGLPAIGLVAYREREMEDDDPMIKISLRSKGEEDTTVISQAFGGGGHKNASSFMIKEEEFLSWKT